MKNSDDEELLHWWRTPMLKNSFDDEELQWWRTPPLMNSSTDEELLQWWRTPPLMKNSSTDEELLHWWRTPIMKNSSTDGELHWCFPGVGSIRHSIYNPSPEDIFNHLDTGDTIECGCRYKHVYNHHYVVLQDLRENLEEIFLRYLWLIEHPYNIQ